MPIFSLVTEIRPERTNCNKPKGDKSFRNCSVSSLNPVFSITKNSGDTVTIFA